jgi:exonuclease III
MVVRLPTGLQMGTKSILVWNVHELNTNYHHDVMHDLVTSEWPSIVCLQETKCDVFTDYDVMQHLGRGFDYSFLPTIQTCGGILLVWWSSC